MQKLPNSKHNLQNLLELQKQLQTMQTAQALGVPLTAVQKNLAMNLAQDRMEKKNQKFHHDEDNLHFETSINVDHVIEGVSERFAMESHNTNEGVVGSRYVGSVDAVTCAQWAKECGAPLYSKEWLAYVKTKRDSGEYAVYFPKATRKRMH